MQNFPQTVDSIYNDWSMRRDGILKALTTEQDALAQQCEPSDQRDLALYGLKDGTWQVGPPAQEVPPELPEPCIGINFARDGMERKAFYYGVKLEQTDRARLFKLINSLPTLFEIVTERKSAVKAPSKGLQGGLQGGLQSVAGAEGPSMIKRHKVDRPHSADYHTGRLLTEGDVRESLQGRQAELYWPDDRKWYLVEIQSVDVKRRRAKILYASGEFEDVDLSEILKDGHMALF